jgi:hypothetical protein
MMIIEHLPQKELSVSFLDDIKFYVAVLSGHRRWADLENIGLVGKGGS